MAQFKPYKILSTELDSLPILEGQYIITTDNGKQYLDISDNERKLLDDNNPIYYWDGKPTEGSNGNSENINLFQKIWNKHNEGKYVYIVEKENSYTHKPDIYVLNPTVSKTTTYYEINSINTISRVENRADGYNRIWNYHRTIKLYETDNIVTKVEKGEASENFSGDGTFLGANTSYPQQYQPKYLGSPTTKKYVDDAITSAISNISGLKPEIVEELPITGNSNIIYLILNAELTENSNNVYDEYIYVNNRWEALGNTKMNIDLTNYITKNDIEVKYYTWSGNPSSTDTTVLSLFKKMKEEVDNNKIIILTPATGSTTKTVFILDKYNFRSDYSTLNSLPINAAIATVNSSGNQYEKMLINKSTITLMYDAEGEITSVGGITTSPLSISFIPITSPTDDHYYTPEYKSQPVSKGYLDEKVPVNIYKFTSKDEFNQGTYEDGSVAFYSAEESLNSIEEDTDFSKINIVENIFVYNVGSSIVVPLGTYYFGVKNLLGSGSNEGISIVVEENTITINVKEKIGTLIQNQTYKYEFNETQNAYNLIQGTAGVKLLRGTCSWDAYKLTQTSEWNNSLARIINPIKLKTEIRLRNSAYFGGWLTLLDNKENYVTYDNLSAVINRVNNMEAKIIKSRLDGTTLYLTNNGLQP